MSPSDCFGNRLKPSDPGYHLPDIAGTFADIKRFSVVDGTLRFDYLSARSSALAYGGDHLTKAIELREKVFGALRRANLDARAEP